MKRKLKWNGSKSFLKFLLAQIFGEREWASCESETKRVWRVEREREGGGERKRAERKMDKD